MKSNFRFVLACLVLSVTLSASTGITAPAAAEAAAKKIDPVRITFSYDQIPKAGEAVGTFQAVSGSREFTVESAEYTNPVDTWSMGDRPRVMVVLRAEEGYRFSYTSSSHFNLNGCGADFIRAKTYGGGDSLELEAYFKYVEGALAQIGGLMWDGTYAKWDELMDAREYEVRLYRNDTLVDTVTARGHSFDFRSYLGRTGDYTFCVRAIARYDSNSGPWSDYSEANSITSSEGDHPGSNPASPNHSGPNGAGSGPSGSNHPGSGPSGSSPSGPDPSGSSPSGPNHPGPGPSGSDGWEENQYGWWYRYRDGGCPTDTWKQIGGCWYFFNRDGYMVTGWQNINGNWYYLNSDGAMLTGWRSIGGRWYYLDQSGAMLTGWQLINGKWYFLDENGMMYAGRRTPDGYYVDGNGVLIPGYLFSSL